MFNTRIKELRLSLNLNQVEFGKKIGVTKQSVCNWENNNIMPSIDMLINICKTLNVSSDWLLGLNERKTIYVNGLNISQISHIQTLIEDICDTNKKTNINNSFNNNSGDIKINT